jgi:hypothetical protein
MEGRPSSARTTPLAALASVMALAECLRIRSIESVDNYFTLQRGRSGRSKPRKQNSCYTAGGPNPKIRGTYVRNPAIAEQVNAMHEKWLAAKQDRDARKGFREACQ